MERLDDIYYNKSYDDNTVIIRVLNTILENRNIDSETTLQQFKYFIMLLGNLCKIQARPNIIYIIEKAKENYTLNDLTFAIKEIAVKEICKFPIKENYKYLFLLCYYRAMYESRYLKESNIVWSEFLENCRDL